VAIKKPDILSPLHPILNLNGKRKTGVYSRKLTLIKGYARFFQIQEAPMKFSTRKVREVVIIDVEGKILLGEGDVEIKQAVDALIDKGTKNILLNLEKVPYIDSAGLGEVIRCFTALRRIGGSLKLLSPNSRIIDLLDITNLLNVFDWYDDESSAVKSFASNA
jgi:anti-sigma B factor antagonist